MNRYTTIAMFGAIFAVTVTVLGANGLMATPFGLAATTANNAENDGMNINGHVTVVAKDQAGTIKAYRQMDNIVVDVGETCTGAKLFGQSGTICDSVGSIFNYIAIGVGTQTEVGSSGTTTLGSQTATRIRDATNLLTNSTGTGATSSLSVVFAVDGGPIAISESGLFDGSVGGHMFARKLITPVVNVQSGDSLTVTWTVTTGS